MKIIKVKKENFELLKKDPENLFSMSQKISDFLPDMCGGKIPTWEGLDHIEVQKNQIKYYDRGCNNYDNSFIIRVEK